MTPKPLNASKPNNRRQLMIYDMIKNYDNASNNRRSKMALFIVYHVIQKAGYDNMNKIITRLFKIFQHDEDKLMNGFNNGYTHFTEQLTPLWKTPFKNKADKIAFVRKAYQLVHRYIWIGPDLGKSAKRHKKILKELPMYITNALELGEQGIRNGTIKYRNNRTTATIAGLQKAGGKPLVNAMSNSIKRDKNNFDKQYKLNKNLDMFYKNLLKIEGLNKK